MRRNTTARAPRTESSALLRVGLGVLGLAVCATSALGAGGCTGTIGGEDEVGEVEAPICGEAPAPGPSPIRRMTRFEYDNTVRDLLGDATRPASQFTEEEEAMGFNNNALALTVTPLLAEKYMLASEQVAERATADVEGLTGCSPQGSGAMSDACVRTFIDRFGKRAFRRPLSQDEKDELFGLFVAGKSLEPRSTIEGFRSGIELVIEATLQSPQFLYRVELGGLDTGESAVALLPDTDAVPLTSWEMASRLSFLLWSSMPDDELLAAAEADELRTKEQVAAQARRLLASDKARAAVDQFHSQWLDFERVMKAGKDSTAFPEWSTDVAKLMQQEMEVFVDRVIFDGEGDLRTLLTAPYTYANADLAGFYGYEAELGEAFERVDLPPNEHAGLLSMGAILAYYAHSNQTSPVHRGKLVREVFLCDVIAPPPADVVFELPMPDPSSTARERFAQHASDPACSGCHELMDPLGFGFETFDAVGRYRTEENGEPVDARGEITASDIDGEFVGVSDLASRLAESREVQDCYAQQWFRWAYGRVETKADACSMEQLTEAFDAADGDVKELLVALTQTDAFMYRTAGELLEEVAP